MIEVLRTTNNNVQPNHTSTQETYALHSKSDVGCVPKNTHSSHNESQLYVFEDNEAVIKMAIRGRSPTMRCILLLLPVSWLTDSLSPFLPSSGYFSVLPPRVADVFFFCALASSGLTATFWSSTSSSRHSRAASCATCRLFCSSSSILW